MGCFETRLRHRLFYSLEAPLLDSAVLSLMSVIESSRLYDIGQQIVVLPRNVEQKLLRQGDPKNQDRDLIKRLLARDNPMDILDYMSRNKIALDLLLGEFPTVLKYGRATLHALKLSRAVMITIKTFQIDHCSFPQRGKKNKWSMSSKNLMASLFSHYLFALQGLEEVDIVKKIKTSLARYVSVTLKQDELPGGPYFTIFPYHMGRFEKLLVTRGKLEQFAFSVLQSKVLCQEVPDSFVQKSLEKHRDQLSQSQKTVSEESLLKLRQRGREFGKLVASLYRPHDGFQPHGNATFAYPRDRGGLKGDLVNQDRLKRATISCEDPHNRMEPLVIGLFGQPGMGKSTFLPGLILQLSRLFPGVSGNDLTYERTSHVEHWDGYRGQPIVILDDLGQSTNGKDIQEFQTLVSCCPYVLPMAALEEKGTHFNSPIIIATSNLKYGMTLAYPYKEKPIIDDCSFWRRFTVPLYVEYGEVHQLRVKPNWVRSETLMMRPGLSHRPRTSIRTDEGMFFKQRADFCVQLDSSMQQQIWKVIATRELFSDLIGLFKMRRHFHENHSKIWRQTVSSSVRDTSKITPYLKELELHGFTQSTGHQTGEGASLELHFPSFPPPGPLPVRVEPIKEPLKVRLITAGIGDTFCLKPFARAMWRALGQDPQFILTHGTKHLDRAIKKLWDSGKAGDVWISGDYTAATDSFPLEATKALLMGILESIEHEPTKRWALKEISAHLLVYPPNSGLEPVLQKSGQLMGSLLSFPLLCLLNDCTARFSGISPDSYTINGDDILMRTSPENYSIWKKTADSFGLELSVGKNYIHKAFGTVNSQLIKEDKVVFSGKQKIVDRHSQILGECLRDWQLNRRSEDTPAHDLELFKNVNRSRLSRTIRSIDVPVSHGGLAFAWGRPMGERSYYSAKLCYMHDLFKRIEPKPGCLSIPYMSQTQDCFTDIKEDIETFQSPVTSVDFIEDYLTAPHLPAVKRRIKGNQNLRDLFDRDFRDLPSLSFLSTVQVPFSDPKCRRQLQHEIDQLFFIRFFSGVCSQFNYETYKDTVLKTASGLRIEKVDELRLVTFLDLELRPEYAHYIDTCLHSSSDVYDRDNFYSKLTKECTPKAFDLPVEFCNYNDFQTELDDLTKEIEHHLGEHKIADVLGQTYSIIRETTGDCVSLRAKGLSFESPLN